MLWDHLNDLDATHTLFGLNEVDSLGTDDDIPYQIPRQTATRKSLRRSRSDRHLEQLQIPR